MPVFYETPVLSAVSLIFNLGQGDAMELKSYKEVLNSGDVALAVKTDGRRFSFNDGGKSETGCWPLDLSKRINKVVVFHSGEDGNVYIGDYDSSIAAQEFPGKYHLLFVNSRLAGRSVVSWTTFTDGQSPGYSRIYLNGSASAVVPAGKPKPDRKTVTTTVFERDEDVRAWVLGVAAGQCELCGNKPFLALDGAPYLEVHHVKRLSDEGSDTVTNTVAICAACHRELHYGIDQAAKREELYRRVTRLLRE